MGNFPAGSMATDQIFLREKSGMIYFLKNYTMFGMYF